MSRNVSEVLLDVLAEAGVQRIYGIPGDAVNNLVEAIRKQDVISFIQVRHEEAGAFAAAAEAKLTGRLSACVGTAGPGALHLLNGLYDAKMDHAPVIAITGQVESEFVGTDYHQEVDLYTLFKDVAEFNQVVMNPDQLPALAVHACQTAIARSGVAHLSLPVDVAAMKVSHSERRHAVFGGESSTVPCVPALERASRLIDDSTRVAILAGVGCRGARDELLEFAEKLGAPIIKSLRAKDVFPDNHPFCIGGLGLLGTRPAVKAIEECDLLLLVGTDFPYHDFYPKGTPAIQIDVDPYQLGKRYPVEVGLAGHAAPTLVELTTRVAPGRDRDFLKTSQRRMSEWWKKMEEQEESDDVPIRPQRVARLVGELADEDAIFLCDTGAVTVWGARHLRLRGEQRYTLSSALASMAFALPASLGAQLTFPERQVIALAGDGGFTMLMADFLTAVKYELPITVIIFNNGKLGLIQMEQESQGFPEFQTSLHNPDFAAFARACGGEGATVADPSELEGVISGALGSNRPWIVEVVVNGEERTMPPKIPAKFALGYGIAKAREFLGQGDKAAGSLPEV